MLRLALHPACRYPAGVVAAWFRQPQNRERAFVLALVTVALAVRVLHVVSLRASPLFEADRPPWDAYYYNKVAWTVASRDVWGGPEAAYLTSPPYVVFLAALFSLAGHDVLLPRLVQAVLGAGTSLLLYLLARRLFGRVAGLFALGLSALYGLFVFYDGELLKTSLGLFGLCAALLLLLVSRRRVLFLVAGVVLGLAVLTMGGIVLFLGAVIAWTLARPPPWQPRLASAAALALGAALVLVPFDLRDRILPADRPVFVPNAGTHFYIGNNPSANGTYRGVPGIRTTAEGHVVDAVRVASEAEGRPVGPREASRYFRARALAFMREEPLRFLALCGRKTRLFFNAYEIPNNEDYYLAQRDSWVLASPLFGYGLVCPLGLTGLLLGLRGRRGVGLAAALLATVLLSTFAAFVTARYRIPAVPALILFASRALAWFYARLRLLTKTPLRWTRGPRALVAVSGAALLLGVLVNLPTPLPRERYQAFAERKAADAARWRPPATQPPPPPERTKRR